MKRNPVRTLSAEVARKIAAGEVIDRPNAILRELLDNAVDSECSSITVEIFGGGIEKIRVQDNGFGMTKEDLSSCARPHSTSKIVEAQDLLNLSTLGFRGEALASIAAVSRLTISSGNYRMKASISEDHIIEEIPLIQNGKGTIVESEGLFENYPARRVFLKRPQSENLLCKETFVEKSLPKPQISFRLYSDGILKLDLPETSSLIKRFTQALELKENYQLFSELKNESEDWSFSLVIGEPSVFRNNRKQILIYVNGRRVNEYSLVQAIEYGCQGFFPNGTHPVAALFVEIKPSLVDFNIHPAKKEIRFRDSTTLHHAVSQTVKEHFRRFGIKQSNEYEENHFSSDIPSFNFSDKSPFQNNNSISKNSFSSEKKQSNTSFADLRSRFFDYDKTSSNNNFSKIQENISFDNKELVNLALGETNSENKDFNEQNSPSNTNYFSRQTIPSSLENFKFVGTALNCFLIAQIDEVLYFIDQHAAHERILFDSLLENKTETQNLMIPYKIICQTTEEENYIEKTLPQLEKVGFSGKKTDDGTFEFFSVPARWKGCEQDLQDALLEKKVESKDILYSVLAMTACKAAIKDGNILDKITAEDLAKKALQLKDPHCPHGRPVWTTLSKMQLFERVRRIR